ncbi:MAG: DUF2062 domain-containing protein [Rhodocyclaceae bacterium]|nr:DUF2062 domain-containing protein [Rhodocyclaceae bacterium]
MRNWLRRYLPDHAAVHDNRWLAPFKNTLLHPRLWHLNRHSVAGGVAVGLFCGLIPGPFQMLGAAICAVIFRINLPLALITTLYTNPVTIVPLYLLAYGIGRLILGEAAPFTPPPELTGLDLIGWTRELAGWLISLGAPLALGLVLLASSLALTGYLGMRLAWRLWLVRAWRRRARRRMQPPVAQH